MLLNNPVPPGPAEVYRAAETSLVPEVAAFGVAPPAGLGIIPLLATAGRIFLPALTAAGVIVGGGFALQNVFNFDISRIPPAAILGGASIATLVLSGIVPEGAQPFVTIGGIGLGILSLLVLFGGDAVSAEEQSRRIREAPPSRPPAGEEAPVLPPGRLVEEIVVTFDPEQPATGGTTRSMFTSQSYAVSIGNNLGRTVVMYAGLRITDGDQEKVFQTDPRLRQITTIPTRQAVIGRLSVPPASGFLRGGVITPFPQTVSVEVELFRELFSAEPFLRSQAIPIKYSFIG